MKTIIATIVLALSLNVSAQEAVSSISSKPTSAVNATELCINDLKNEFELIKAEAVRRFETANIKNLQLYTLVLMPIPPNGSNTFNGMTYSRQHIIRIDPAVCNNMTEMQIHIIVAHEFGHAIIHLEYPDLAKEAYSALNMYSTETHEAMANNVASTIFPNDQLDAAFAVMDKMCKAGSRYQCERLAAWRYGVGRYE